jgi:hypothetical protein
MAQYPQQEKARQHEADPTHHQQDLAPAQPFGRRWGLV